MGGKQSSFVGRLQQSYGDVLSRFVLWPGVTPFSGWKLDLARTSDVLQFPS